MYCEGVSLSICGDTLTGNSSYLINYTCMHGYMQATIMHTEINDPCYCYVASYVLYK